jgi:hypothetical protein
MELMSPTTCPHGLSPERCHICQVLEPTAVPADRAGRRPARRDGAGLGGNLAVLAVVGVVGFVVLGWVAAAFFAALRIVELLAVAAIAGWVGWKLGRHGRRHP